jgi:hypothetical protein
MAVSHPLLLHFEKGIIIILDLRLHQVTDHGTNQGSHQGAYKGAHQGTHQRAQLGKWE